MVRASTRATVYAFFSTATAAASTISGARGVPRKKAIDDMLARIRTTVSDRCASVSDQSSGFIIIYDFNDIVCRLSPNGLLVTQPRSQRSMAGTGRYAKYTRLQQCTMTLRKSYLSTYNAGEHAHSATYKSLKILSWRPCHLIVTKK